MPAAPFGPDLAILVADRLERAPYTPHAHPYYRGTGLAKLPDGTYVYGEVEDARMDGARVLRTFADREELVTWLASASDESMSRRDEADPWYWRNQTITRDGLLAFIRQGT